MGLFYAGNIGGAVIGCLAAGFFLLPRFPMMTATLCAVALNVAAGAGAALIARRTPQRVVHQGTPEGEAARAVDRLGDPLSPGGAWRMHAAIALSGAAALGAEVIWTRLLSLLLGATVYVFSIILAVYLLGLGIGSAGGAALAARLRQPRLAFGVTQLLLAAAIFWAGWLLNAWFPYWPLNPSQAASAALLFQLDVLRCALAVLPAATLWGASFPFALAAVARQGSDPARIVGRLYAANTLGAIIGALTASLVAVHAFGTHRAQQGLVVVSALAATLALVPAARPRPVPVWLAYAGLAIVCSSPRCRRCRRCCWRMGATSES
jgi:spermidine synthase